MIPDESMILKAHKYYTTFCHSQLFTDPARHVRLLRCNLVIEDHVRDGSSSKRWHSFFYIREPA